MELSKNQDFEIAKGETFSEHFKGGLRAIAVGIVGFLFFILIADSVGDRTTGDRLGFVSGVFFLIALFPAIGLMLEGPSFATYVKKRNEYFARMKYAIINTANYLEFVKLFYS